MEGHPRGQARAGRGPRSHAATAPRAVVATYKLAELARAGGVTPRAVRLYVTRDLLPAPVFRGRSTTYNEDHLVRLRAIARLRVDEGLQLDAIRSRLAVLSPDDLAALGAPPPLAGPPAAPLLGEDRPAGDPLPGGAERWDRLALLPGLELHVRGDATAVVRRLAAEIHARYGALPPEGSPAE